MTLTSAFDVGTARVWPGPRGSPTAPRGRAALRRRGVATTAEEIWRYSRIEELDLGRFRPSGLAVDELEACYPPDAEFIEGARATAAAVTTLPAWSSSQRQVLAVDLDPPRRPRRCRHRHAGDEPWIRENLGRCSAASVDAFVDSTTPSCVAARPCTSRACRGERPILVVHRSVGDGLASFPHTLVVAGENAEVTVADHFSPTSRSPLGAGRRARRRRRRPRPLSQPPSARLEDLADRFAARAHRRDATARSSVIALGASTPAAAEAALRGSGASSDQLAVYYADGEQMLDFRTCRTRVAELHQQSVVQGRRRRCARSVYSGMVHIREGAEGCRDQSNRNLVLSEAPRRSRSPTW